MNKKSLITVLVVAVILLAAVGLWMVYSNNNQVPNPVTTPTVPQGMDEMADQQDATQPTEIVYTDNGFEPTELTVTQGETIRIVNQSSSPLEFSSDQHPTHTDNRELNTEALQSGEETTIMITETGAWGFHNHLRANDTGRIVVE